MRKVLILFVLVLTAFVASGQQVLSTFNGKFNVTSVTGTNPTFNVSGVFNNETMQYTGVNAAIGDKLYIMYNSKIWKLHITAYSTKTASVLIFTCVDSTGLLPIVPTGQGTILRETPNYQFPYSVSGLRNDLRAGINNHFTTYLDSILNLQFGNIFNDLTVIDSSLLVVDSTLNALDSAILAQPGGIYGGSDTVPPLTTAYMPSGMTFSSDSDTGAFSIYTGVLFNSRLIVQPDSALIQYQDIAGENKFSVGPNGVVINTTGPDRLYVKGQDARYTANYSAFYDSLSIPHVGWVQSQIADSIAALDVNFGSGLPGQLAIWGVDTLYGNPKYRVTGDTLLLSRSLSVTTTGVIEPSIMAGVNALSKQSLLSPGSSMNAFWAKHEGDGDWITTFGIEEGGIILQEIDGGYHAAPRMQFYSARSNDTLGILPPVAGNDVFYFRGIKHKGLSLSKDIYANGAGIIPFRVLVDTVYTSTGNLGFRTQFGASDNVSGVFSGNADIVIDRTGDLNFRVYPSSRNDTGVPVNVLTTNNLGDLRSHPISEVVSAGGGVLGSITDTQIGFGSVLNQLTSSPNLTWNNTNTIFDINAARTVHNSRTFDIASSFSLPQTSTSMYNIYSQITSIADNGFTGQAGVISAIHAEVPGTATGLSISQTQTVAPAYGGHAALKVIQTGASNAAHGISITKQTSASGVNIFMTGQNDVLANGVNGSMGTATNNTGYRHYTTFNSLDQVYLTQVMHDAAARVLGTQIYETRNALGFTYSIGTANGRTGFGWNVLAADLPEARAEIRGEGTTSSTYGLIVTPSGGVTTTASLAVRDDGKVFVGTNTGIARFEIREPNSAATDYALVVTNSNANSALLAVSGDGTVHIGRHGSLPSPSMFSTNTLLNVMKVGSGSYTVTNNYPAITENTIGSKNTTTVADNGLKVVAAFQGMSSGTDVNTSNIALLGQVHSNSNGTYVLNRMEGVAGSVVPGASSNTVVSISHGAAFAAEVSIVGTSTTVSNMYGFRAYDWGGVAGATITNSYGVYLGDMTPTGVVQTNLPYGIYQADATIRNYFGGNTGLGELDPTAKLHVDGTVRFESYPNSLNSAGSPVNVLTTDASGNLESHTVAEVVSSGGGTTGTGVNDRVTLWGSASTLTSSSLYTYDLSSKAIELNADVNFNNNRGRIVIAGVDTINNVASARHVTLAFSNSITTSNTGQYLSYIGTGTVGITTPPSFFIKHNNTTVIPYYFTPPLLTIDGGVTGTIRNQTVHVSGASGQYSSLYVTSAGATNALVSEGFSGGVAIVGTSNLTTLAGIVFDVQTTPTLDGNAKSAMRFQNNRTSANGNGIGVDFNLRASDNGVRSNYISNFVIDNNIASFTTSFIIETHTNNVRSEHLRIGNNGIGINLGAQPSATIHAKGIGSTSATYGLIVTNSTGITTTAGLAVRDNSSVLLGGYPNTLNSAGSPVNVLTTDASGNLESHTIAEVVSGGGGAIGSGLTNKMTIWNSGSVVGYSLAYSVDTTQKKFILGTTNSAGQLVFSDSMTTRPLVLIDGTERFISTMSKGSFGEGGLFIGYRAGPATSFPNGPRSNLAVGNNAFSLMSASSEYNVVVGNASVNNLSGTLLYSTIIGNNSLPAYTGNVNYLTIVGRGVLINATTVGSDNTLIGASVGGSSTSIGSSNTLIGRGVAGGNAGTTYWGNSAIGVSVLNNVTSATHNSILGGRAGMEITSGSFNTIIGYEGGGGITTGTSNIHIGGGAFNMYAATPNISNTLTFGRTAKATADYQFVLGDGNTSRYSEMWFGFPGGSAALSGYGNAQQHDIRVMGINNTFTDAPADGVVHGGGKLGRIRIVGPNGTGTGYGGDVILAVCLPGTTGTTMNPPVNALTVKGTDGDVLINANANTQLIVGNTTGTGKLYVQGAGSTSSTWTAQFHNSTGTNNALRIRDDGHVAINVTGPIGTEKFTVIGGASITGPTNFNGIVVSPTTGTLSGRASDGKDFQALNTSGNEMGYLHTNLSQNFTQHGLDGINVSGLTDNNSLTLGAVSATGALSFRSASRIITLNQGVSGGTTYFGAGTAASNGQHAQALEIHAGDAAVYNAAAGAWNGGNLRLRGGNGEGGTGIVANNGGDVIVYGGFPHSTGNEGNVYLGHTGTGTRGKVGIAIATTPAQTLHVAGTMRLTGSDGTATTIMGRDADGDVSAITLDGSLTLTGNTLSITTPAAATNLDFTGTSSPVSLNSSTGTDVTFVAGTNVTLSATGSALTINATGGGGATNLDVSGTSSPLTLTSDTGTDVIFTANTGISFTGSAGNFGITNTAPDQTVVLTNGTGINATGTYPNFTITNTAPDQTVVLTSGTGISATGTYPNFTITNTAPDQTVSLTGAGINVVTGTYPNFTITGTEVDGSTTNEIQTYGHAGTTSYTNTLSNSGGSFTLQASGIAAISHTAGTVTITATEVDGSVSNELQALSHTSGPLNHTATLSNSGGSLRFNEGTSIDLVTSGTGADGIVTITNTAPDQTVVLTESTGIDITGTYPNFTIASTVVNTDAQNLSIGGAGPTYTMDISGGTGTTFQGAGILTLSESPANTLVFTATEVDGSTSNELQTFGHAGTTTYTNTLSNGGGAFSLTGAGIAVISQTAGAVTITATEVDGSTSNELQTFGHAGTTSYTNTLSNGGGSFTLQAGGIVSLSHTTGTTTISATEVDGSITNEIQNLGYTAATGALTISSGTGTTIPVMTASIRGLTPDGDGAGTDEFLREDGTWAVPPGGSGSTDLGFTGTATPITLTSSSGADVVFADGTGIDLTVAGSTMTVTNNAPDQTVVLSNGAGINTTGTYPNFTIASTITQYTDELAQDATLGVIASSATIDFTYDDALNDAFMNVKSQMSLTSDASGIKLVNDAATPGNTKYYGTNGSGTKGFFDIPQDLFSTTTTTKGLVPGSNSLGANYFLNGNGAWTIPNPDGNGIYTGSGTVTTTTIVDIAATMALYFNHVNSAAPALGIDETGFISMYSPNSNHILTVQNSGTSITPDLVRQFKFNTTGFEMSDATDTYSAFLLASNSMTADYTLTLPVDDGTTGQVLSTNGSGVLSWITGGGGGANLAFTGASSPVTLTSDSGTDVIFAAGAGVSLTQSTGTMTVAVSGITNTELASATGGLYKGSGTIAAGATATLGSGAAVAFNYFGGTNGFRLNDATGTAYIQSKDATQYFWADNTSSLIGSGTTYAEYRDGVFRQWDSDITQFVGIQPPATANLTTSYTLTLPTTDGNAGESLITDGTGVLSWKTKDIGTKGVSVENPTATENITVFYTNQAITITELNDVVAGTGTPSCTYNVRFASTRTGAATDVLTANRAVTSTTGSSTTTFNDATIPADSWIWIITSAIGGTTLTDFHVTINYTID